MRRVQAGYEQCADTYQVQIKMLNENAATQRRADIAATALAANGGNDNDADQESAHPAATGTMFDMPFSILTKSSSWAIFRFCSADFGIPWPVNQLHNNQKMDELEVFVSHCSSF